MQNSPPPYPIESVDHALRLLLVLRERKELRVTDAAEELGVARSTAHRLLTMLRYRDFVTQDSRKLYRPGPVFFEIGLSAVESLDIRRIAHKHLDELCSELGETVHLMALEGNGVRFLDGIEGPKVLRVGTRTGMLLPAHCASGGKALLAELSPEELHALYPRGLSAVTDATITDLARLKRELALIRKRGYATNVGESVRGISAVAVCVRDQLGRAVAALAVAIPAVRFAKGSAPAYARSLARAAAGVGAEL